MTRGIDVSRWQGDFDFEAALNEGWEFAVLKGGGGDDGLYVDGRFEENYNKTKKLKIPVGCYFFGYAKNGDEAKKEAEYFYENCLKGKKFELPVFIDVEGDMLKAPKEQLTKTVKIWCETLEKKGFFVGIYASLSVFCNNLDDKELLKFTHWVARWAHDCGYKNKDALCMWQFGGNTNLLRSNKVAGVVCDQNYMFIDFESTIKRLGLNGFEKTDGEKNDIDKIAREVIRGEWGNGEERKERLKKAGYSYEEVQNRVNELLSEDKKSIDEIANEVIRGEWGNGEERKKRLRDAGYDYDAVQKRVNEKIG